MAAQLPLPNAANIQAAVNGITTEGNNIIQNIQTYNAHQQQLATEMSLCANYNVAQIQQQLATITQQGAVTNAQFWNLRAEMRNAKVHSATGALSPMRSVESGPNPRVPANQLIPNFPATPDDVSQMNAAQCRDILTSLDTPIPQGPQVRLRRLHTAVREAIGLSAL